MNSKDLFDVVYGLGKFSKLAKGLICRPLVPSVMCNLLKSMHKKRVKMRLKTFRPSRRLSNKFNIQFKHKSPRTSIYVYRYPTI